MGVFNKSDDKYMGYLSSINKPQDLKKLSFDELGILAEEIRLFLLDSVSKTGAYCLQSWCGRINIGPSQSAGYT